MSKIRFIILTLFFSQISYTYAAKVDTLNVVSTTMGKTYRTIVVLPDSYTKSNADFPVLYLLHGAFGHFNDWLTNTPDKMLVKNLADQYNLIFVLPEGEVFSFYLDSPINKESQFESFIAKEVVEKIDSAYRTVRNSKGRVIAGLSMGGHGAIYLATRHPDLFCAAGSMSGALELSLSKTSNNFRDLFVKILGPEGSVPDLYAANSVVNMIDKIKINGLKLVIDCGVDDFLIDANREMHKRLVNAKAPHDYTERPGGHTWDYWQNSLPYQVLFFYNVLKGNQVIVPVSK